MINIRMDIPENFYKYLPKDRPYTEIEAAFHFFSGISMHKRFKSSDIKNVWLWGDIHKDETTMIRFKKFLADIGYTRKLSGAIRKKSIPVLVSATGKYLTGKRKKTFEAFWKTFNHKIKKLQAADEWLKIDIDDDELLQQIMQAAKITAEKRVKLLRKGHIKPIPATNWLKKKYWKYKT